MTLEKKSPCKVNLLLNILGRRADGFHELETVMQPVKAIRAFAEDVQDEVDLAGRFLFEAHFYFGLPADGFQRLSR